MPAGSLTILCGVLVLSCASRFVSHTAARQLLLLGCSYLFYSTWAGLPFLLLLIASSLMNCGLGAALRRRPHTWLLWLGIVLNVLLLGAFKYLRPLAEAFPAAFDDADVVRQIVLPLGISFWTFQAISYLVDVYLEKEVDPTPLEFCLYMAFWPTVISGPVCRLTRMLPQFRTERSADGEDVWIGVTRCTQGLFMKLVLAQLLASGLTPGTGVAAGFDRAATSWNGIDVWALALGYAFQLFFDFAGYSHIVIGAARLAGFQLQENFDHPFVARTPAEFWSRWHISLSTWIRDYVYAPVSTLRREWWWQLAALFISMVVFGFWHQAKMTFVVFGAYHGMLLVSYRVGQRLGRGVPFAIPAHIGALLSWATTLLFVLLGFVVFRADSMAQALEMWRAVVRVDTYHIGLTVLSSEYYALVLLVAVGYAILEGGRLVWRLWVTTGKETLRGHVAALPAVSGWATLGRTLLVVEGSIASTRRWWAAPVLVLLLVMTSLTLLGESSTVAPFLYIAF